VTCKLCSNECQIGESQYGFCGLRTAQDGRLKHLAGTTTKGMQHWYRDPLPTNCVARGYAKDSVILVTTTWPYFIQAAQLSVYFAKTGITARPNQALIQQFLRVN
jgi:hypothetical protein